MKDSFIFETRYKKQISMLSDAQAGVLLKALLAHETEDNLPDMDGMTELLYSVIEEKLDYYSEKYEATCAKRAEAGKKGQKAKQANAISDEANAKLDEAKQANADFAETDDDASEAKQANAIFAMTDVKQTQAKQADTDTESDSDTDKDKNIKTIPPNPPTGGGQLDKIPKMESQNAILDKNFEILYSAYPKKKGRTVARANYRAWLKGKSVNGKTIRLTNEQMYRAIRKYVAEMESTGKDYEFWKNFDTLMGRQLLDYVEGTT